MPSETQPMMHEAQGASQPDAEKRSNESRREGMRRLQQELVELARPYNTSSQYFLAAFRFICDLCGAVYGSIDLRLGALDVADDFRGKLYNELGIDLQLAIIDAVSLEAQSEDRSIVRTYNASAGSTKVAAISIPMHEPDNNEPIGGAVFVVTAKKPAQVNQAADTLNKLVRSMTIIGKSLSATPTASSDVHTSHLMEASNRASGMDSIEHLALAMTNSLCQKNGCCQVAFGRVDGKRIEVVAVSGMDQVVKRSPGIVTLSQAMEECFDKAAPIVYQRTSAGSAALPSDHDLLHRKLHESTGNAILSLPIRSGNQITAVVTLQRSPEHPFTSSELDSAKASVEPFGPSVELLYRASRSLSTHGWQTAMTFVKKARSPKTALGLASRVAVAAALLWFFVGWMPFTITVPCNVQPAQLRHVVAPFPVMLDKVHVRPGDHVAKGQVLLEFDKRELKLVHDELNSQLRVLQIAMNRALAERRASDAATMRAEMEVLDIRLATTQRRLTQAEVRAEFDGIVLNHDLTRATGKMLELGEPLLELAPNREWFAELSVPERFGPFIENGQQGTFVCKSKPGHRIGCQLSAVSPHIEALDGGNVFLAEAQVEEQPEWMRPGMEGVARVKVGWKPVFWIYLHRVWDFIRLRILP